MSRRALNGPKPTEFPPDGIVDGSKMGSLALDLNTAQNRFHRPISLFPVPNDYTQLGIFIRADLQDAPMPWQPIGTWFIEEEYSEVQVPLEAYLLVAGVGNSNDGLDSWEFQWKVSNFDGSVDHDTVNGVVRDNIQEYRNLPIVSWSLIRPNIVEGRPSPAEIRGLTTLEFRGADMPDISASGVWPQVLTCQTRANNDPNHRSYNQRLYVFSVLITGEAT